MLRKMLKAYRRINDIPMRVIAKEMGIPLGTLWRFENGKSLRQDSWQRIMVWLIKGV